MKSPCDMTGAESQLPDVVRLISGCKAKPPEKRPAFCGHRVLREVKTDVLSQCWCRHSFLNSDSFSWCRGKGPHPRGRLALRLLATSVVPNRRLPNYIVRKTRRRFLASSCEPLVNFEKGDRNQTGRNLSRSSSTVGQFFAAKPRNSVSRAANPTR